MILLRMFLWFWGWSSWRLWGLIPAKLLYFWVLLNLLWCCLCSRWLGLSLNALGRFLFIGVWGWVSDTWQSLIDDTCHSLIGPFMSLLKRVGSYMSSLTCAGLLVSSLTRADAWLFLHDTWQISVGFWVVIAKPSSNTWHFVIGCILWTW